LYISKPSYAKPFSPRLFSHFHSTEIRLNKLWPPLDTNIQYHLSLQWEKWVWSNPKVILPRVKQRLCCRPLLWGVGLSEASTCYPSLLPELNQPWTSAGRYSLSTRSLLELQPYLQSNYPDQIVKCSLCEEVILFVIQKI
jgi:hypothetical protein